MFNDTHIHLLVNFCDESRRLLRLILLPFAFAFSNPLLARLCVIPMHHQL